MTNLLGLPVFLSTVSAMMAAMTAPTKPTPMTTTTSLPSRRAWSASACNPRQFLGIVGFGGDGKFFAGGVDGIRGHETAPEDRKLGRHPEWVI